MKLYQLAIIIVIAIGWLMWSAHRDTQIEIAADKYEECVRKEYGTSPSRWYQEHKEYPVCK